ncbi:MAG: lysophospholipase [Proteobacteria bacterium]|nr:lysophospholipase [Pseudomonadota bacterium]
MRPLAAALTLAILTAMPVTPSAQPARKWVTSWAGSVQGPYPIGNPSAQPDLRLVFPDPAIGARDQTFRLIVRPDLWGKQLRLRFSNALGTRPVSFDGIHVGVQLSGAALLPGTNRPVAFAGKPSVTVPPGESVWSDAVTLPVAASGTATLAGRKLAVSFHVAGDSGPMTWHAKALTSSYVTAPGTGAVGAAEDESRFPYSTASWYFLDALDVMAPADTRVVVAFGDSITDGTASTLNGDDRWPDVLSRRLHATHGDTVVVVNAGIGGNRVIGPADYAPQNPIPGGPAAVQRLERDVLGLSGVTAVIWLEGINDLGRAGNATAEAVIVGYRDGVARLRARLPGVRVIGATVTSALGSSSPNHGFADQETKRQALNAFIRNGGLFDGVADFDRVTRDPATGELRPEFVPDSTIGNPGDKLHPNRAGYLAMGLSIDLELLVGKPAPAARR